MAEKKIKADLIIDGTVIHTAPTLSTQSALLSDIEALNTIYAEPGIFSGGGTPTLASGVTGAEIRSLIGAGTVSTIDTNASTVQWLRGDGTWTAVTADVTEVATVSDTFTSVTTKEVTHSFGTKNVFVTVYNTSDEMIIPESIVATTVDTVDIGFANSSSGTIIVAKGGHLVDGTLSNVPWANITGKPTIYDLDVTPVNGATTKSISSDWAYDHAIGETVNLHTKVGTISSGTWNGAALTQTYIGTGAINPAKLDDEFKTIVALGAGVAIDWSTGQIFTKTLTAAPTYTFSNLHIGVKFIETTGDYSPTFPTGFTYIGGTRATTGTTLYQVVCTNTSTPVGYYSIYKDES